jgi:hypothetical protein
MATLADAIVFYPRLQPIAAESATHMWRECGADVPACIDLHQGAYGKLLQTR